MKSNPGAQMSAQCGKHGYRSIKPRRSVSVPALRAQEAHVLRATLLGAGMQVFADDVLVWDGTLGDEAQQLNGRVGMRSDNARLQIELCAAATKRRSNHPQACSSRPHASE